MRELLTQPGGREVAEVLPAELEERLARGWRVGPGGSLLLAPPDDFLNGQSVVPADEVGAYEYRHNDFRVPDDDLARDVASFASRLTAGGALVDDDHIDYRTPEGELPEQVRRFLSGAASRGLAFASRALARALQQQPDAAGALVSVISTGVAGDVLVHGTAVKFTTARGKPSGWFDPRWFDDLERFKLDAMAVLSISDARPS